MKIPEFVPPEKTHVLVVCRPDTGCSARGGPVAECDSGVQHPLNLESGASARCLPLTDSVALKALGFRPDGIVINASVSRLFPSTDDYYPPAAAVHHEEGTVQVRACVNDSSLVGEPTIVRSSGSENLDDGALTLARAGSGKYLPALDVHGMPVRSCFVFQVKFNFR
jgi:TonB family protein